MAGPAGFVLSCNEEQAFFVEFPRGAVYDVPPSECYTQVIEAFVENFL